jgi:hypothetical protein
MNSGFEPISNLNLVRTGLKQRLPVGLPTPKCKHLHLLLNDVELAAHQTVRPMFIDSDGTIQESNVSFSVSPAHKDHQRLSWRS